MEGCTRWLLILGSQRAKSQHRDSLQRRLLKHRFQKMLPELSGARSVAPWGKALRGDVVFNGSCLLGGVYSLSSLLAFAGQIKEATTDATRTQATTPSAMPTGISSTP